MKDLTNETEELSLDRLLGELDELESVRAALLERVEQLRVRLLEAGDRSVGIRASVQLLCDHISVVMTETPEIEALEQEMRGVERDVGSIGKESSGLEFESDSLQSTLEEAEQELDRLSSILVERKVRHPKGH
ncbi:MAG TPA: hypothetical protein VKF81_05130 [Blastocatellia bacterium]|nr:hypothetical protein [Blastocatellia bacterium]